MLRLALDSAPYTELDFPKFNPEGCRRVQQAVEMAQQQKAFAQDTGDLQQATYAMRMAVERKGLEQQIARKSFEAQRRQAFELLRVLQGSFRKTHFGGSRRLEVETRIDHLVTLFNLKDFDEILKQIRTVRGMLSDKLLNLRLPSPPLGFAQQPISATALFLKAQQTERAGRIREAVELYGRVLERNPHHFQAIHCLGRLGERAHGSAR